MFSKLMVKAPESLSWSTAMLWIVLLHHRVRIYLLFEMSTSIWFNSFYQEYAIFWLFIHVVCKSHQIYFKIFAICLNKKETNTIIHFFTTTRDDLIILLSTAMPKAIQNAKIACLDFSLQKTKMKMGVQLLIDDPEQLDLMRQR